MLRLRQEILITQVPTDKEPNRNKVLYFPAIKEVQINESFDDLTDTAIVELPRNLKYEDRNIYEGENPLIRRGDKIKLSAGYYPNLDVRFEGYISKIDNNVPVVLKCEDSMWILKQKIVPNKTFQNTNLPDVMDYIMEGIDIEFRVLNASGFDLRINDASVGTILKKLRDELGIYSWFKNGVLYVGQAYYPDLAKEKTFLFEKVIIDSELQYLKKEDVKIKVKGILINSDNTREEISVGDEDGDLRTVFQYGGTTEDLKRTINSFLEQANYTGYYGSFTTFLEPKVTHGYYAVLNSYKYPERKGKYLIKSVATTFGVNGGRQEIELERRIE
jgi:hypothetical protein